MLSVSEKSYLKSYKFKALSLIKSKKKVSSLFSFYQKGGMTVEGCLVLPLFLFFMVTLLYTLEIVRFQGSAWEAVHQAGSKSCFFACEVVSSDVKNYLDKEILPYLCVEQGRDGIDTAERKKENGEIEVTISYKIRPFFFLFPIGDIGVSDCFYGHDFGGYKGGAFEKQSEEAEAYVYVTETGSKYHFSADCTYLKVIIQAIRGEEILNKRNASGEKYYACERCKPKSKGLVYLTEWGNRYHASADCSALKRKVFVIPISLSGGRTPCSKCGGNEREGRI